LYNSKTKLGGEKRLALQRHDEKAPYFEGTSRDEISVSLFGLAQNTNDLPEKGFIQLPEPKRPKEVGSTADPKYCRYHRMVSHPPEKYVMIKEHIM